MRFSIHALTASLGMVVVISSCGNRPPGATLAPPTNAATPVAIDSPSDPGPALSISERALLEAARNGDTAQVQSLLDKGLNVNLKDGDGRTPLTEAVYWGHADTVKLLLARGADVNAKKNDGATPFTLTRDNKEIEDLLQQKMGRQDASPSGKASKASPSASPAPSTSPKNKKS